MKNNPWKIGSDVYSYISDLIDSDAWGNVIEVSDEKIESAGIVIKKGSSTNIGQAIRIMDFCGLINKSRKADKVSSYFEQEILKYVIEKPKNIHQHISNHILERIKHLRSSKDMDYIKSEFKNNEKEFLFSVASIIVSTNDQKNIKFIEMQLDGTKISDYLPYFKGLTHFLATDTNGELLDESIEWLVNGKNIVNKIISSQESSRPKIVEIWSKISYEKRIIFTNYNLGKFLKNKFNEETFIKIPIYQRKYRWSENNVLTLIRDIYNISKAGGPALHNIGILITKTVSQGTDAYIKVIDGQQRLTTMMVVLRAAYDYALYKGYVIESIAYDKFKNETEEDTEEKINDVARSFARIEGNEDFEAFRELMIGNKESTYSNTIIYRNYYAVIQWLATNIITDKEMHDFWDAFMKSLVFSTMNIDEANEFLLFEKLNTGGIPLKPLELTKNFLLNEFSKVIDADERFYQNMFQNFILKYFEKKSGKDNGEIDDKKVEEFITGILRVRGFEPTKVDSKYNQYRNLIESYYYSQVDGIEKKTKSTFKKIMKEMSKDIKLYNEMINYDLYSKNTSDLYNFADYLFTLQGRSVYYPLLFKIFEGYFASEKSIHDVNKVRKLLHVIETYEVRFQIVSYRGQSLGPIMSSIAKKLDYSKTTPKQLFNEFANPALKGVKMPSLIEFKKRILEFDFENNLANKFTVRFENYIHFKGIEIEKDSTLKVVALKKISREHIMPSDGSEWYEYILKRFNVDQVDETKKILPENIGELISLYDNKKGKIGNALPIKKYKNSELGKKKWDLKRKMYVQNGVIPELALYAGFSLKINNKEYKMKKINNDFDLNTIEKRTQNLTDLSCGIWGDE